MTFTNYKFNSMYMGQFSEPKLDVVLAEHELERSDFDFIKAENGVGSFRLSNLIRLFRDPYNGIYKVEFINDDEGNQRISRYYFETTPFGHELFRPDNGPTQINYSKDKMGVITSLELMWVQRDLPTYLINSLFGYSISERTEKIIWHRDNDLPAIIRYTSPTEYMKEWYKDGLRHRDKKPAIVGIRLGCDEFTYCRNGKVHRLDGPAKRLVNVSYFQGPSKKTIDYAWVVNHNVINESLYPIIKDNELHFQGKAVTSLDKSVILDTLLFDREYGTYINNLLKSRANTSSQHTPQVCIDSLTTMNQQISNG